LRRLLLRLLCGRGGGAVGHPGDGRGALGGAFHLAQRVAASGLGEVRVLIEQLLTTAGAKSLGVLVKVDVIHELLLMLWRKGIEVDVIHRSVSSGRHGGDAVEELVEDWIWFRVVIRQLFNSSCGSAQIRL